MPTNNWKLFVKKLRWLLSLGFFLFRLKESNFIAEDYTENIFIKHYVFFMGISGFFILDFPDCLNSFINLVILWIRDVIWYTSINSFNIFIDQCNRLDSTLSFSGPFRASSQNNKIYYIKRKIINYLNEW